MWRTHWRRARWWLLTLLVAAGLLVLVIGGYGFGWDWTGLDASPKSTTMNPAKSVWDWLQLLIIPAALAGIALWFNWQQSKTERTLNMQQSELERELAQDQQRETMLQEYINRMTELLLGHNLRDSQPGDEVRQIARVRTLATMRRLDGVRNGTLLHFLQEAHLREVADPIVDLSHASLWNLDLSGVDLSELNLSNLTLAEARMSKSILLRTNLSGSFLEKADLRGSLLFDADLSGVSLSEANLSGALVDDGNLKGAKLRGATLPDGSVYNPDSPSAGSTGEPPTS